MQLIRLRQSCTVRAEEAYPAQVGLQKRSHLAAEEAEEVRQIQAYQEAAGAEALRIQAYRAAEEAGGLRIQAYQAAGEAGGLHQTQASLVGEAGEVRRRIRASLEVVEEEVRR